jgi:CO dehydrogenase maturation factor
MRIAIAGKGGSGKTTIAATIARLLARVGHSVLAIDGDSNPNLGVALGLSRDAAAAAAPVPSGVLEEQRDLTGKRTTRLGLPVEEIARRYGVQAPDGVTLLVMGRVAHAGAG